MPHDPPSTTREDLARELLRYKMMEYSQEGFFATWMVDLEWELWTEVDRPDSLPKRDYIRSASLECRMLAEIAGGWWAWDKEVSAAENPVFIPMERWLQVLAERSRIFPS